MSEIITAFIPRDKIGKKVQEG